MNRRNFLKLGAKAGAAVGAVTVGVPVLAKAAEPSAAGATVQPQTFEEWLRDRPPKTSTTWHGGVVAPADDWRWMKRVGPKTEKSRWDAELKQVSSFCYQRIAVNFDSTTLDPWSGVSTTRLLANDLNGPWWKVIS